jgi:chromosome segregation ATPase
MIDRPPDTAPHSPPQYVLHASFYDLMVNRIAPAFERLRKQVARHGDEIAELHDRLDFLPDVNSDLPDRADAHDTRIADLQDQIDSLQDQIQELLRRTPKRG